MTNIRSAAQLIAEQSTNTTASAENASRVDESLVSSSVPTEPAAQVTQTDRACQTLELSEEAARRLREEEDREWVKEERAWRKEDREWQRRKDEAEEARRKEEAERRKEEAEWRRRKEEAEAERRKEEAERRKEEAEWRKEDREWRRQKEEAEEERHKKEAEWRKEDREWRSLMDKEVLALLQRQNRPTTFKLHQGRAHQTTPNPASNHVQRAASSPEPSAASSHVQSAASNPAPNPVPLQSKKTVSRQRAFAYNLVSLLFRFRYKNNDFIPPPPYSEK
jgi:hypothetical protein